MGEHSKDGGPAFPQPDLSAYGIGPQECPETGAYLVRGMSLRDYLAGQAICAMVAPLGPKERILDRARAAYEWADAMLIARQKGEAS